MQLASTIAETRQALRRLRAGGAASVGFVPTMGYLHEGHLSLVRAARAENGATVVSIFVNPTQFGPAEDFDAYPRDLERDLDLLRAESVDLVFHPRREEMYPASFLTGVQVRRITEGLCGASRPGHFDGVATVVTKLLNIVRPERAYFGMKDAQQLRVIQALVRDLDLDVEIRPMPIVRKPDGLAMSSRNARLSPAGRRAATVLHRSLREVERMVAGGERNAGALRARVREILEAEPGVEVDYVSLVHWETLEEARELAGEVLVALAAFVDRVRLIDNAVVRVEPQEGPPDSGRPRG